MTSASTDRTNNKTSKNPNKILCLLMVHNVFKERVLHITVVLFSLLKKNTAEYFWGFLSFSSWKAPDTASSHCSNVFISFIVYHLFESMQKGSWGTLLNDYLSFLELWFTSHTSSKFLESAPGIAKCESVSNNTICSQWSIYEHFILVFCLMLDVKVLISLFVFFLSSSWVPAVAAVCL